MTDPNASKKPNRSSKINSYARYSGIVFQMIAIIGVMSFAGVKLDEAYPNKHSLWTIGGSLLGVVMAMVYVIRRVTINKE